MDIFKESTDVLFQYTSKPSYGKSGDDGGYSITIYADGRYVHEKYQIGNRECVSRTVELLPEEALDTVINLMINVESMIMSFPDRVIGCCDGDIYTFKFGTKEVVADNSMAKNHPVRLFARRLLNAVNYQKKKYNIDVEANMPRMVYAPPDVMRNMKKDD